LDNVENQLKNLMKPASLVRERLNEQMRLVQVLQADVDSHEGAMQKMNQSAQEFVQSSKNVRESKDRNKGQRGSNKVSNTRKGSQRENCFP
jgi:conjugal transfer/entry exclusion protein